MSRPYLSPLAGFGIASAKTLLEQEIAAVGAGGFELVFAPAPSGRVNVFGSCRFAERKIALYPDTISRYARTPGHKIALARGIARHEALHAAHSAPVNPAGERLLHELERTAPQELAAFMRIRNVLEDGFIEQIDAARDPSGYRSIAVANAIVAERAGQLSAQTPILQTLRALATHIRPAGDPDPAAPQAAVAGDMLDVALAGCAADPAGRAVAIWRCLDILRAHGLADSSGVPGPPRPLPSGLAAVQLAPAAPPRHVPASAAELNAAVAGYAAWLEPAPPAAPDVQVAV